ncbi:NrdH-redoxin [Bacillus mangrovi]|uniref:NrdH-redoxin n=1 Tax=Metabacillus mangrovi TaxID=1491830 RepID=A0A7X2V472_9BACI|nr:glutaredoxin family protein [Metabacillus mangrovi]MTH53100.1 NrdH-redoxin [Metabacillus mangrovi]
MTKKITLYTQPDCPPCKITRQFLDHHKLPYEVIDVSEDQEARTYLTQSLQSYSTPTVTVGEKVVKGFNLQELEKLVL